MTKILYVEDNEDNIYMLTKRLSRTGYEVVVATDGEQGVRMSRAEDPSLIIKDHGLPVLDGWQAIRQIRSCAETSHIPIIALTAHAMAHDRAKARDAGCDEFDTKPVNMPRLLEKIESLLNGKVPS
jgi:two-component system, cell cycle response regulator DivK